VLADRLKEKVIPKAVEDKLHIELKKINLNHVTNHTHTNISILSNI